MKPAQAVCNYSILRFRPYAETEEFVNVGVLVACQQPCLLHFVAERKMPARAKALFPQQNEMSFEAALEALRVDMERAKSGVRDPKGCQMAFNELVRIRESVFRFGEVRTILTATPQEVAEEVFARYVRMEEPAPRDPQLAAV
jgi:hypothetical protein